MLFKRDNILNMHIGTAVREMLVTGQYGHVIGFKKTDKDFWVRVKLSDGREITSEPKFLKHYR